MADHLSRKVEAAVRIGALGECVFTQAEMRHQQRRARSLQRHAADMGYKLIPVEAA
jgi:hypothetical protein